MFWKDKNKLKIAALIVQIVLLAIVLPTKFVYVDLYQKPYFIRGIAFFGVLVTFVCSILCLKYLIEKDDKKVAKLYFLSLSSYLLPLLYIPFKFSIWEKLKGEDLHFLGVIHPRIGFYLYYLSLIPFVYAFLIKIPLRRVSTREKMIKKPSDIRGEYLICYYKDGSNKNLDNSLDKISVIIVLKKADKIVYAVDELREKILYENIVEVNVCEEEGTLPCRNSESDRAFIAAFLFKNLGAFIAREKLYDDINDYCEMSVSKFYTIEIVYLENGKKRKIVFASKINPDFLVRNIKNFKSVI